MFESGRERERERERERKEEVRVRKRGAIFQSCVHLRKERPSSFLNAGRG